MIITSPGPNSAEKPCLSVRISSWSEERGLRGSPRLCSVYPWHSGLLLCFLSWVACFPNLSVLHPPPVLKSPLSVLRLLQLSLFGPYFSSRSPALLVIFLLFSAFTFPCFWTSPTSRPTHSNSAPGLSESLFPSSLDLTLFLLLGPPQGCLSPPFPAAVSSSGLRRTFLCTRQCESLTLGLSPFPFKLPLS